MLDTVRLQSPYLPEDLARTIEQQLDRIQRVNIGSGELQYELVAGPLDGSYDTRVHCRLMREEKVQRVELERVPRLDGRIQLKERKRMVTAPCEPYVLLEGSVHKAMLGHNICGGPESFQAACEWLVSDVGGRVGADLPPAVEWLLRRADWAECYDLPYEAAQQFVNAHKLAHYPKRKPGIYADETVGFAGSTTKVNVYHKGPEFWEHDRKRLKGLLEPGELESLQQLAHETLRAEVQIKAPKLRYDVERGKLLGEAGQLPRVGAVTEDYLKPVHDHEMVRLIGDEDGAKSMKKVREQVEVRRRLVDHHGEGLASVLFGTWMQLAALGESEVRRHMKRSTLYRHTKQLREAGVAWFDTDVHYLPRSEALPRDFAPLRTDPRRRAGEHPTVSEKLAPFRAA